ncbi:MAG: hypothetical protein ACTSU7_02865 [Candidatus Heimdallarchaeaceae archaeon]
MKRPTTIKEQIELATHILLNSDLRPTVSNCQDWIIKKEDKEALMLLVYYDGIDLEIQNSIFPDDIEVIEKESRENKEDYARKGKQIWKLDLGKNVFTRINSSTEVEAIKKFLIILKLKDKKIYKHFIKNPEVEKFLDRHCRK